MKVTVLGATGMVGSALVAEGRRRGHDVLGASRREGAAEVVLDLTDTEALTQLAPGNDALIVSVPPPRDGSDHGPWVAAHERLAAHPPSTRLALVGGAGSSLLPDGTRLLDSPDFPPAYLPEATSAARVLEIFRAADGADWVVLSPAPVIAPGERTGAYRTGADEVVGDTISAEDYAIALWDELETPEHRNRRFTVAG